MMKIGYGFWGHLADTKIKNGSVVTAPDGNYIYSSYVVKALSLIGADVFRLYPNRDFEAVNMHGSGAFSTFAQYSRAKAYNILGDHPIDLRKLEELDAVLIEWRWPIEGRNTRQDLNRGEFQPDLMLQDYIIRECNDLGIPLIALDLDYKMRPIDDLVVGQILELGFKRGVHVNIPFDFKEMETFQVSSPFPLISYIGNRYDRDWAVDKYLGSKSRNELTYKLFGNWLSDGRDSAQRWPHINFMPRINPVDMRRAYQLSAVAPVFLKDEYCEHGFMTARLIETLFYGSLPVFIDEFQHKDYYLDTEFLDLVVSSQDELEDLAMKAYMEPIWRREKIRDLKSHFACKFDTQEFAKTVMQVLDTFDLECGVSKW